MYSNLDDTICAIATAPGSAARGIVRISGRDAVTIAARLLETEADRPIERFTRATAVTGQVRIATAVARDSEACAGSFSPAERELQVPCELFVWPTSRSYTREPVVELHAIGSPPILEAVVAVACRAGARLAEPGEFTLRAFLAGRIDLTQAEAVLGVIDARHADELAVSLSQLAGGLAKPLQALRENLLQLLAELEAGLDFVEDDIVFVSREDTLARLQAAQELVGGAAQQLESRQTAPIVRQIALIGPPNAGKSSLFNALVERYRSGRSNTPRVPQAIVSPQRGTTRDYLTATLTLHNIECELIDTAGVEAVNATSLGSDRSPLPTDAAAADVVAVGQSHHGDDSDDVQESAALLAATVGNRATIRVRCREASDHFRHAADIHTPRVGTDCDVLALTKADLLALGLPPQSPDLGIPCVLTSSHDGRGLDLLCNTLHALLSTSEAGCHGRSVGTTAARCRDSIRLAESALHSAYLLAEAHGGGELIAAEIRSALHELGKVVGVVYTDDVLDRIFSTFCIGK